MCHHASTTTHKAYYIHKKGTGIYKLVLGMMLNKKWSPVDVWIRFDLLMINACDIMIKESYWLVVSLKFINMHGN